MNNKVCFSLSGPQLPRYSGYAHKAAIVSLGDWVRLRQSKALGVSSSGQERMGPQPSLAFLLFCLLSGSILFNDRKRTWSVNPLQTQILHTTLPNEYWTWFPDWVNSLQLWRAELPLKINRKSLKDHLLQYYLIHVANLLDRLQMKETAPTAGRCRLVKQKNVKVIITSNDITMSKIEKCKYTSYKSQENIFLYWKYPICLLDCVICPVALHKIFKMPLAFTFLCGSYCVTTEGWEKNSPLSMEGDSSSPAYPLCEIVHWGCRHRLSPSELSSSLHTISN